MLSDTLTPDGYRLGEDGAWVTDDPYVSYDANYPLKDSVDKAAVNKRQGDMGFHDPDIR